MTAPVQMVFAGQGPMYMGTYDATNGTAAQGFLTGVRKIGCGNRQLQVSLSREVGEVKESCSGQALTLGRWGKSQAAKISLQMAQFSREQLALALYGTSISRAASTASAEVFPTVAVDDYVHLKHPNASSVVITDSAGTPATLTAGTHYMVDSAAHGRIQILDLAAFTQPLKAAYSYAGYSQVTAFTASSTRRGLIFDGINVAEGGTPVRVFIPLIDFDPASNFNWLGQDEATLQLDGEILYSSALSADTDWGAFFRVDALPVDA